MCRFMAYHGPPIPLDELLYQPDHSIIQQSIDAQEREEPLNGDGWGVGWYDPSLSPEPAVYREVRPAWNDENMRQLIRSCVSIFSTGSKYRRFRGLKRPTRDSIAV